ncbi:unnamed protein product, partial [Ectocarpus sp. 8 AP-2014]
VFYSLSDFLQLEELLLERKHQEAATLIRRCREFFREPSERHQLRARGGGWRESSRRLVDGYGDGGPLVGRDSRGEYPDVASAHKR